jgi:hypothetical protein
MYFISTVGINEEVIRRYLELQEEEEIEDKHKLSFEYSTHIKAWESILW